MEELRSPIPSQSSIDVETAPDGKKFFVEIEDREYPWPRSTITFSEIRTLGDLPSDLPVIEVDPDNNERTLAEGETVTLKPGHRFGKKVRYKRGFGDRMAAELELLRRYYPRAEWRASTSGGWIRLPEYLLPPGLWGVNLCDVCFEVRGSYPGEAPYGFYVATGLRTGGQRPQNYDEPATTPFPGTWGRFSWSVDGAWMPRADVVSGTNLTTFVRSFRDRLLEGA
jgi:hypothetical protein